MTEASSRRSPVSVLALVLDNARLLLAVPALAALAALAATLLLGSRYTAESSFKPQQQEPGQTGRLAGLAAQFGVAGLSLGSGESVKYYARLATSRALLEPVALTRYRFPARELSPDTLAGTLLQLYHVRGRTQADRLTAAIDRLDRAIDVSADEASGVVTIGTTARWPGLATQINRRLLDEISRFNLERRQSQAGAERRFVALEAEKARQELQGAEDRLADFMEHNRGYEQWPPLRMEAARLQRRVELSQQVYAGLVQTLEQARVEEVRNTPVLTIIDPPEGSVHRRKTLVRNVVLGAVLGLAAVVAFLFLREYADDLRRRFPEEYALLRARARRRGRTRARHTRDGKDGMLDASNVG